MILPEPLQQVDRTWVNWRGQTLAYFAGCDYFRMASHPEVLFAAHQALEKYGLNVAASRWTTGNHELYDRLEKALAAFFGAGSAILLSNGYMTNTAAMHGIRGDITHLFIDEHAHSSLTEAAKTSDRKVIVFRHRDGADLARRMADISKPLVMTDGVFAHDGSIAPLQDYARALGNRGYLLVDDSHGAGVLGENGRGAPEHCGVDFAGLIQTTTLSKAFGSFGGAVLARSAICEAISDQSPLIAGATPFPLPCAAAALASLRLLKNNSFRERLRENVRRVGKFNFPIISTAPPDQEKLKRALVARGIFPPHIRYQNGPPQGYFRFAISSEHSRAQLGALADALTVGA